MRRILLLMSVILTSQYSYGQSQSASPEAIRVAELMLNQTWEQHQKAIPALVAGLKAQVRQVGATERAASQLADEMAAVLSQEQFTSLYARVIGLNLTQSEIVQLDAFLRSNLGKKYLNLYKDVALPVYLDPLRDRAFLATCAKLDKLDKASLRCE